MLMWSLRPLDKDYRQQPVATTSFMCRQESAYALSGLASYCDSLTNRGWLSAFLSASLGSRPWALRGQAGLPRQSQKTYLARHCRALQSSRRPGFQVTATV